MTGKSRTATGDVVQRDSVAGPEAYTQGGFTIGADLGRVDEASVTVDDETYHATATAVNNHNEINVVVVNVADGTEVAADTDLSGASFSYEAVMQ